MHAQITIKLYVFVFVLASTLRLHFAEQSSARADNLDEVVNLQLILAGARVFMIMMMRLSIFDSSWLARA